MKKIVSIVLSIMLLSMTSISLAANFSDISGHWAESYITDLTSKGIINGYPDGTYKPDGILTCGEFFKLIVVASLPDADLSYVETGISHWAGVYAQVLINFEIIEPSYMIDDNLDAPITRMEVVNILSQCDIIFRKHTQMSKKIEFTDIADISNFDKTLLAHAVASGIINGDPEGTFRPNDNLKRSEVAKILHVYYGM